MRCAKQFTHLARSLRRRRFANIPTNDGFVKVSRLYVAHECRVCRRIATLCRYERAAGGSPCLHYELGVHVNELAECHALVSERLCKPLLRRHGSCNRTERRPADAGSDDNLRVLWRETLCGHSALVSACLWCAGRIVELRVGTSETRRVSCVACRVLADEV